MLDLNKISFTINICLYTIEIDIIRLEENQLGHLLEIVI